MISGLILILLIILYLIGNIAHVLFLIFAAVLLALLFTGIAGYVNHKTFLSYRVALVGAVLFTLLLLSLFMWQVGPRISDQFAQLFERIPEAISTIRSQLLGSEIGSEIWNNVRVPENILSGGTYLLGGAKTFFSGIITFLVHSAVVLFLAVYFTINPALYIDSIISLFHKNRRNRIREVVSITGRALRWWLFGRISSMITVGILTTIGLLIIGMPLAFSIGFIAGLLSFVPYIGPILTSVPAILVGLSESPPMALKVLIVLILVQFFESYLITPLIQQKAVSLPPALLISMQVLMGVMVGAVGVFLATPLVLIIIVWVQLLYMEDILHEKVIMPGDHSRHKG